MGGDVAASVTICDWLTARLPVDKKFVVRDCDHEYLYFSWEAQSDVYGTPVLWAYPRDEAQQVVPLRLVYSDTTVGACDWAGFRYGIQYLALPLEALGRAEPYVPVVTVLEWVNATLPAHQPFFLGDYPTPYVYFRWEPVEGDAVGSVLKAYDAQGRVTIRRLYESDSPYTPDSYCMFGGSNTSLLSIPPEVLIDWLVYTPSALARTAVGLSRMDMPLPCPLAYFIAVFAFGLVSAMALLALDLGRTKAQLVARLNEELAQTQLLMWGLAGLAIAVHIALACCRRSHCNGNPIESAKPQSDDDDDGYD